MADPAPTGAIPVRIGCTSGLAPGVYVVCVTGGCPAGQGVDATAARLPDGARIVAKGSSGDIIEACKASAPQLASFLAPLAMRVL